MSEDQAAIANTLFPPPPVYYKEYVDEKIGIEELEPPRVDWVEEETRWMCFGDVLSVSDSAIPSDIDHSKNTDISGGRTASLDRRSNTSTIHVHASAFVPTHNAAPLGRTYEHCPQSWGSAG